MSNRDFGRVAVTGATGMVGARVVVELMERGYRDIVLPVRDSRRAEHLMKRLAESGFAQSELSGVRVVQVQLNNPDELRQAFDGVGTIYHCAASVNLGEVKPQQIIQTNVEITSHVVNAALQCSVVTLVHVSSIAALGEAAPGTKYIDEGCDLKSTASTSPYGVSKFMSEHRVMRGHIEGLRTIIVNPGVILGESEGNSGSAPIIGAAVSGVPFYTTGVVGYVDIRDVARAMVTLAEDSAVSGERYILVGANLSVDELLTMAARVARVRTPFIPIGRTALGVAWRTAKLFSVLSGRKSPFSQSLARTMLRKSYYDGGKIKKVCNFEYTSVEKTIERVVAAYVKTNKFK